MLRHAPATRLQCKRDAEPHCLGRTVVARFRSSPDRLSRRNIFGQYMARAIRDGVLITLDDPKMAAHPAATPLCGPESTCDINLLPVNYLRESTGNFGGLNRE